jgi:hypothetical protein
VITRTLSDHTRRRGKDERERCADNCDDVIEQLSILDMGIPPIQGREVGDARWQCPVPNGHQGGLWSVYG